MDTPAVIIAAFIPLARNRRDSGCAAEVKRRARAKAAEMIRLAGTTGTWKPGSPVTEYIEKVSKLAVDKAKIRDSSKTRYRQLLEVLAETRFLGGYTIADAARFRNLETALVDLAAERGRESGR